ncbi:hypothetical protein [Cupriavidus necator]
MTSKADKAPDGCMSGAWIQETSMANYLRRPGALAILVLASGIAPVDETTDPTQETIKLGIFAL